jgi:hypothetical protein
MLNIICKDFGELKKRADNYIEGKDIYIPETQLYTMIDPDIKKYIDAKFDKLKKDIKELKELKILRAAPVPKSFIEIWDNKDDEIWNDYK